jgi:hypothetical protein
MILAMILPLWVVLAKIQHHSLSLLNRMPHKHFYPVWREYDWFIAASYRRRIKLSGRDWPARTCTERTGARCTYVYALAKVAALHVPVQDCKYRWCICICICMHVQFVSTPADRIAHPYISARLRWLSRSEYIPLWYWTMMGRPTIDYSVTIVPHERTYVRLRDFSFDRRPSARPRAHGTQGRSIQLNNLLLGSRTKHSTTTRMWYSFVVNTKQHHNLFRAITDLNHEDMHVSCYTRRPRASSGLPATIAFTCLFPAMWSVGGHVGNKSAAHFERAPAGQRVVVIHSRTVRT